MCKFKQNIPQSIKFTLSNCEILLLLLTKTESAGGKWLYIRALFCKCRRISTVGAHFSGLKKCAESAAFRQICTFVQKCEKVQNSCGVNSLIYNCKRRFRTNVLFFLLYYTQEKNNYKILFHVEHKKLKFNNLPKQSEAKKARPPPRPPTLPESRLCGRTDARLHPARFSSFGGRGGESRSGRRGVQKCPRKSLHKCLTIANFVPIMAPFAHMHAKKECV